MIVRALFVLTLMQPVARSAATAPASASASPAPGAGADGAAGDASPAEARCATAAEAPSPGCAALVVRATGVGGADLVRIQERLRRELREAGVPTPQPVPEASLKEDCFGDRACIQSVIRDADSSVVLRVELLRAGAYVQIRASVFDADGRLSSEGDRASRLEALLAQQEQEQEQETALPAGSVASLRSAIAKATPAAPAPVAPPRAKIAQPVSPPVPAADTPPPARGWSALAITGLGVAVAGALAGAIGGAGAIGQLSVADDAGASGAAKEAAATLAPVFLGIGVAGVVATGAGTWLLWSEVDG